MTSLMSNPKNVLLWFLGSIEQKILYGEAYFGIHKLNEKDYFRHDLIVKISMLVIDEIY